MKSLPALALLAPLMLAACGDLPQPFAGQPGALATHLAAPPIARLVVIPPGDDPTAALWAKDTAAALVAAEMPALVGHPDAIDWSVRLSLTQAGGLIVPHYALYDGTGKARASITGTPLPRSLWGVGNPDVLTQSAKDAAPQIGDLLTGIEAARMNADPNSLVHRAARLLLLPGQGATGDGDRSLPAQMAIALKSQGILVTRDASQADYRLRVEVVVSDAGPAQQQVQIIWILTDAQSREAGRIAQLNDVPAHSLDGRWGEVAAAAASQAAGGVAQVIANQLPSHKMAGGA